MQIYSNKRRNKLLGVVYRYKKKSKKRENISPINEYLQVSSQKYKKNDFIKPHVHLKNKRTTISKFIINFTHTNTPLSYINLKKGNHLSSPQISHKYSLDISSTIIL